jgi:chorismate dehydratase
VLRVGSVPYLVGRPVDLGLEMEKGIHLERAPPAELVEKLRSRELDVALVSSIELFRQPDYRYLRGPAIASRGFVSSVQMFSRVPWARLSSIALDPHSHSSSALARIVLDPSTGLRARSFPRVEFREVGAGEDPSQAAADGWLRIGDRALVEYFSIREHTAMNPSEMWTERTGLPFVFALWIVAGGVELTRDQLLAFSRARARGEAALPGLAAEGAVALGIAPAACRVYLTQECVYDLGDELELSLLAFRDQAARLKLCAEDLELLALADVP